MAITNNGDVPFHTPITSGGGGGTTDLSGVNAAISTANSNISNINNTVLPTLQTTISSASAASATALSTAQSVNNTASTALSTVNNVQSTASTALNTANTALITNINNNNAQTSLNKKLSSVIVSNTGILINNFNFPNRIRFPSIGLREGVVRNRSTNTSNLNVGFTQNPPSNNNSPGSASVTLAPGEEAVIPPGNWQIYAWPSVNGGSCVIDTEFEELV